MAEQMKILITGGMAHHWEVFDQEWVDTVSDWLATSGAKKTGAAMVLAPLTGSPVLVHLG
mgnify:CR=1 FL=1